MFDRLRFREGIWERMEPAADAAGLRERYELARDRPESSSDVEREILRLGAALGLRVEPAFPGGW